MNVILVDDSTMVRARLTTLLSGISGVQVVGHAGAEDEAVDLIVKKQPDLVILDISLEVGSGINVLRRIQQAKLQTRVIMLTNETARQYKDISEQLGAHEFFDKSMDLERLVEKIKEWL
jgi:DNA-binding NarL/FixJ family response regulator